MTVEPAHAAAYRAWLARRSPHVRARLERLNPAVPEAGGWPRGWFPSALRGVPSPMMPAVSRGRVIRRFGRDVWDRARAAGAVRHHGKRQWVHLFALLNFIPRKGQTS